MKTMPGSATAPLRTAHGPPRRLGGGRGRPAPYSRQSPRGGPAAGKPPQLRREGGYVTFFVLAIAASIFLALGSAMQANSCLREANRRQAQQQRLV